MPSDRISNLLERKPKDGSNESTHAETLANDIPPAPPPLQSMPHNPYDFITNPAQPAKKKLLPGGGTQKSRIIQIVVGALIFLLVAMLAINFISSAGGGIKDDYLSLAQQQTELIRLSDIGIAKAKQAEAKNFATTTRFTLVSQQPTILGFAKQSGVTTDSKILSLGKDPKTDATFTLAEQSNEFDAVFMKKMQDSLNKYRQTLKKVYDGTSNKTTKATLSKHYKDIGNLIGA